MLSRRHSIDTPPYMSGDEDFRALIFGTNGSCQFIISNSMLMKDVYSVAGFAIAQSQKHGKRAFGRKCVLVNTPNLSDYDQSEEQLKIEFKKAICMSSPGPYAVLFALDLNSLASSITHFQLVIKHFGECILKYLVIVVCHDEEIDNLLVEEMVKISVDFKKLIEQCDQRYHLFSKRKAHQHESMTRLIDKIDEMVVGNGSKYYSNVQYEDAEGRIKREEMFMMKKIKKEKRRELQERFSGKALDQEIQQFEANIKCEIREKAERQVAHVLGSVVRTVDSAVAIVKGALVGGLCGAIVGFEGIAFGVVCGSIIGGFTGGAAGALWRLITDAAAHYRINH